MEKRIRTSSAKSSSLPVDYLKMVGEIFRTNFDDSLVALRKLGMEELEFVARGQIFPDEILLAVSLIEANQLAANTVFASCEFDPKASQPTAEDLLSICVDAVGTVFSALLDPENTDRLEQVAARSLAAIEEAPFEWTEVKIEKRRVFVRADKSNLTLDEAADAWLRQHDPRTQEEIEAEEAETEKLFVTGASAKGKHSVH